MPSGLLSAGDPNSGSCTRTAMTTNWAIAPTSLESISKAEPAIKLPKQCSCYFSLHVSTEIHSLYSNQASSSHFLNLQHPPWTGHSRTCCNPSNGARELPLGTCYSEYNTSQGYTVRLLRTQTRMSRVRNTDWTNSFIFGKSWLSSPIHNTAQKSVLQSNTITI